jgi:hypothetical protein
VPFIVKTLAIDELVRKKKGIIDPARLPYNFKVFDYPFFSQTSGI